MPIKSTTIKIGADTKDFVKEIQVADKEISKTQKTANELAKSLQFEYSDAKFTSAQRKYQEALRATEENAEKLREKMAELAESGRIDSADYSELELQLAKAETKAGELKRQLQALVDTNVETLSQKFENAGEKMTSLGQKMTGVSVAAAGVLAGGVAIAKSSAETGAEIDDLSQRFNVSAETIQRWRYLAMQGGVDADVFTKSLVKMRAVVADVAAGTSNKATEALFSLGVDPTRFSSTEEMFNSITAALAKMEDKTLQAAYANEIFGDKIATEMLQYLNTGAEEIAKWNAEFDSMPTLTGENVEALAAFDDVLNRFNTSTRNAGAMLGSAFAPVLERFLVFLEQNVLPAIEEFSKWFESLDPFLQDTIAGFLGLLALSAPMLLLFGNLSKGIGSLVGMFENLNAAQVKTAAGFAAIGAAIGLAFDLLANWQDMTDLEKVLKTLALAALVAAAAMTVFHSSWSLGLAVGAITAGVVAGVAAINAAKDEILPGEEDVSMGALPSAQDYGDYTVPNYTATQGTYTENTYSDTYNVTVQIDGTKLSAEEIADAVGKRLATLSQARR
ncbi:MAG: hypothetical protein IJW60_03255 [Clostridia bacterium]|nr:hypothetical protein [Clostridia bacterium]